MKTTAIILAGGKGVRMGAGMNKIFLKVADTEIIARTIDVFNSCRQIDEIILVSAHSDFDRMNEIITRFGFEKITHIVEGGAQRGDSVYNGLSYASGDIVLIHDGARCLITEPEITAVIADTVKYGAAATGVTVKDTLKTIDESGRIVATVDRDRTVQIQTPQGFATDEIRKFYTLANQDKLYFTDDCSIFEHYGKTVHFTKGSYDNIKITTPEDITVAEEILKRRNCK